MSEQPDGLWKRVTQVSLSFLIQCRHTFVALAAPFNKIPAAAGCPAQTSGAQQVVKKRAVEVRCCTPSRF